MTKNQWKHRSFQYRGTCNYCLLMQKTQKDVRAIMRHHEDYFAKSFYGHHIPITGPLTFYNSYI